MVLGFLLGFIAAYVVSAAIAIVLSQSIRAASSLAKLPAVFHSKSSEIEMDDMLFDELRCI